MKMNELQKMIDELVLAWETAELLASGAQEIVGQAMTVLEAPSVKQTSASGQTEARFMTLAAMPFSFPVVAYAADGTRQLDPQTWAENLTKQYDATKGAQRYKQLAEQLGTDAKSAYEQMVLAQKIIHNAATLEEAEAVVNAWTESINYLQGVKTASKIGLFVTATIASGGGSLSALSTSTMTLGEAGATIVGGVDCIVDIADTGSNIILGEDHQVTVAFGDVKDKLAPVSSIVGLVTFDPSKFGKITDKTGEQFSYIGDTLVDLFYEGKVMGVKVSSGENGGVVVNGQVIDVSGMSESALVTALKAAELLVPEKNVKTIAELMGDYELGPEDAMAKLDALVAQMAELIYRKAPNSAPPAGGQLLKRKTAQEWVSDILATPAVSTIRPLQNTCKTITVGQLYFPRFWLSPPLSVSSSPAR